MKKLWMRKATAVLVAIVTLGLYVPPMHIDASTTKQVSENENINENRAPVGEWRQEEESSLEQEERDDEEKSSDYYINMITYQAKEQAVSKLGPKIASKVEDDFNSTILPKIEEVLSTILADAGENQVPYYAISEQLNPGYGEKIFNVYDARTKKDIARFDVRRDKRPDEGYWFNFHYHLSEDGFEKHHQIGEIYWDKNTPPKWMS